MKKVFAAIISLFILVGCSDSYVISVEREVANLNQSFTSIPINNSLNSKYLVLVNKDNLFNKEYLDKINLVDIADIEGINHKIESETYDNFIMLQKALSEKGIIIGIQAAYRTMEDQQLIWDTYMVSYGENYTKKYAAVPGTSEHHTGLAIDIAPKVGETWEVKAEEVYILTKNYITIHEMLHEYGFILRYPKGKEYITGYEYEPWHIRYVGKEAATEIYNSNLTLEEYLVLNQNN